MTLKIIIGIIILGLYIVLKIFDNDLSIISTYFKCVCGISTSVFCIITLRIAVFDYNCDVFGHYLFITVTLFITTMILAMIDYAINGGV